MEQSAYHVLAKRTSGSYTELARLKERYGTWRFALKEKFGQTASDEDLLDLEPIPARLILKEEIGFPVLLREMPNPPHGIYVIGKLDGQKTVGIVGTRKATPSGLDASYAFASFLAEHKIIVISGLAFGIDAEAHRGATDAKGISLAVLPCGIDSIYPKTHKALAEKILALGGALISEYPPGIPALPYRFLERNRVISGLSSAIVVIEAPMRSGSLATTRFALEQNREIFVVPGPATHRNYKGSHALIRSGARLVTSPEEILSDMNIETSVEETLSQDESAVLRTIQGSAEPLVVDEIIGRTTLTTSAVCCALSLLALKGIIRENGGGYTIIDTHT
ncbi:MAG: DNA-processing protein DprA [Patescibacteria group bacterium]